MHSSTPVRLTDTSLFDNYAEAVIIINRKGDIAYSNPAFETLTGYTPGDWVLPGLQHITDGLQQMQSNCNGSPCEPADWLKKDGSKLAVTISISEFALTDESEISIYTLKDNSEVVRLRMLLENSENSFISLADSSPAMIWIADADNNCYYFNKSWLDFTGKTLYAELGKAWTKGIHADDVAIFEQFNLQLKSRESFSCELRLRRNDGIYRNIYIIATPRFLPGNVFAGYMGSCLDITEMKKAQAELNTLNTELKRSNEELEQFAYVASHDLQEPLRMISAYATLIQKSIASGKTEDVGDFMAYLTDGVSRMQALINDLLQFSRVNRKGKSFTLVDLNETLKVVANNLSVRIEQTHAVLEIPVLPIVTGDAFQLIRLFQNLVDNALKFNKAGTQPIVNIYVEEKQEHYQFAVKDNGIGIDNKFYNRIFAIFQRLHTRKDYDGTGIGLAVCKKIAERHGGEIWVESTVGEGSVFYFTIKK